MSNGLDPHPLLHAGDFHGVLKGNRLGPHPLLNEGDPHSVLKGNGLDPQLFLLAVGYPPQMMYCLRKKDVILTNLQPVFEEVTYWTF